jgi:hypothetical protein
MSLGQHNSSTFPFEALERAAVATHWPKRVAPCQGHAVESEKAEAALTPDPVSNPQHYNQAGIECIDAIAAATVNKAGIEAACVANVVKYLWRYEAKGNPIQDVEKAIWYAQRLLQELKNKEKRVG